jgi:hypothetical protein
MAIAGAAFGASQGLEEAIGIQMLKAKLAEQLRSAQAQEDLERQRLDQNRQALEGETQHRQQTAKQAASDKATAQTRQLAMDVFARVKDTPGVVGDSDAAALAAYPGTAGSFVLQDGVPVRMKPPKEPKLRAVTGIGPKGEPINRMAAEDEEVQEWRAPEKPTAPAKTDTQWVELPDGTVIEAPKGAAPPGSRPYTGTMSRDDANREVSASKQHGFVKEAIAALADLRATKGQAGATGMPALSDPGSWPRIIGANALPGSPAAVYDAKRRAVISKLVVPRLDAMRGLGQMSDREFANMVAGTTAMGEGRLSETEEIRELDRLEKFLADADATAGRRNDPGLNRGITATLPDVDAEIAKIRAARKPGG